MTLHDLLPAKPVPAELRDAAVEPTRDGVILKTIDWKSTMQTISASIAEVQARRSGLVALRDDLLLPAANGDRKAAAQADALDRDIGDLDRQLDRLHKAQAKAGERISAEDAAQAAAKVAANWEKVEKRAALCLKTAEELDKLGKLYSEKLDLLITLRREMHLYAPAKDSEILIYSVMSPYSIENAARVALRSHGVCNWATPDRPESYPTVVEVVEKHNVKLLALKDKAHG
jgi:prefoldin subunit 5